MAKMQADVRDANRKMFKIARAKWRALRTSYKDAANVFMDAVSDIPDVRLRSGVQFVIVAISKLGQGSIEIADDDSKQFRVSGVSLTEASAKTLPDDLREQSLQWIADFITGESAMWAAFAFGRVHVRGDADSDVRLVLTDCMLWSLEEHRFVGFSPTNDPEIIWTMSGDMKLLRQMLSLK